MGSESVESQLKSSIQALHAQAVKAAQGIQLAPPITALLVACVRVMVIIPCLLCLIGEWL
jgi:nucleoside permease NupC